MKKFIILSVLVISGVFLYGQNSRFEEEGDSSQVEQEQPAEEVTKPTTTSRKKTKSDFWSRTRFGGNLGAGFSNGFSYVNVSPRMYYLATEKLWLGTGLTFNWSKNDYYTPPIEQFVYGFNLSAQYMLFGPIFLQAEYEPLSFEKFGITPQNETVSLGRTWVHGLMLGGGVSQRIGQGGMVFISIMYNVTWSNEFDSYYRSPWVFRIGFGI